MESSIAVNRPIAKALRYRLSKWSDGLTALGVYFMLQRWGLHNARMRLLDGECDKIITADDLRDPFFQCRLANSIRCEFVGGPPGGVKRYSGTVFNLFVDRLTSLALQRGVDLAADVCLNGFDLTKSKLVL